MSQCSCSRNNGFCSCGYLVSTSSPFTVGKMHYVDAMPKGLKHDQGKPPLGLVSREAMEQLARVLDFGQQKYERWNWSKGLAYQRVIDAALRHLYAFADGEDNDSESLLPHIAHAMCCCMFLLDYAKNHPENDDRRKR